MSFRRSLLLLQQLPELPVLHLLLSCLCSLLVYWPNNTHKELLRFHQNKKQVKLTCYLHCAVVLQNAVQALPRFFVVRDYPLANGTRGWGVSCTGNALAWTSVCSNVLSFSALSSASKSSKGCCVWVSSVGQVLIPQALDKNRLWHTGCRKGS